MPKLLHFTEEDYARAAQLEADERITPLNRDEMFKRVIYCLLSSREYFEKQMKVYNGLMAHGFDNPENILSDPEKVAEVSYSTGKAKTKSIINLAEWWPGSDLPEQIIEDVQGDQSRVFDIRADMSKAKIGTGEKCASLFLRMCGYYNIVPLDLWAERLLTFHGYKLDSRVKHITRDPNQPALPGVSIDAIVREDVFKGGLRGKKYLQYEQLFIELAEKYEMAPAKLQMLVYAKFSTWNSVSNGNKQLILCD